MKKIRTASVRATTAEIEAEQNEKRQRNNSPRLTIVKIMRRRCNMSISRLIRSSPQKYRHPENVKPSSPWSS